MQQNMKYIKTFESHGNLEFKPDDKVIANTGGDDIDAIIDYGYNSDFYKKQNLEFYIDVGLLVI